MEGGSDDGLSENDSATITFSQLQKRTVISVHHVLGTKCRL
jgi:hypothetical protein